MIQRMIQDKTRSTPTRSAPARYWLAVTLLTLVGLAGVGAIWRNGQPVALPDVPEGRLDCVSYTPRTTIPGSATRISRAQIDADLALLAPETRCVRTYSSRLGMEAVPEIARRHGLHMLLGIWIGRDAEANEAEIEAALAAARAHPEVIEAIIVGNEVLLRHEQTVAGLRAYVERVNAATDIPVTYADVWEFWRTGAELAAAVDFVTIHILPYWENEPVGVDGALAHVRETRAEMQALFPGMRLVIGETGWPTEGRQREGARPSLVNGARFIREFVAWATAEGIPYNVIEAFDQPWKRGSEGTVGGYWGLYDAHGNAKFPLAGPVVEDPNWRLGLGLAAAFALLAVPVGRFAGGGSGWRASLWFAALGLAAGALLYAQWLYIPPANRDAIEFAETFAGVACGWLIVAGLGLRLGQQLTSPRAQPGPVLVAGAEALRARDLPPLTRMLSLLRLVLLFGIAYVCLGLALDARYRDFPLAITVLPALLLTLQHALGRAPTGARLPADADRTGIEERTLAAIIVVCALASAVIEGPANLHALAWTGSCLLLGGSLLLATRVEARDHEGGEQGARPGRVEPI